MKKIWILSFIVICFTLGFVMHTQAQPLSEVRGKNLLNLSNIYGNDVRNNFGYTHLPIQIKKTVGYTLVFDQDYLGGQLFEYIEDYSLVIKGHGTAEAKMLDFQVDYGQGRAYIEFTMQTSEWIHFEDFPLPDSNHLVMLYEGSYAHFTHFEPFIHPDEVMRYEGYLPMDYDNLLTTEQIKQFIVAKSPDGVTIGYDTILDTFTPSLKMPGTYQMNFRTQMHNITKNLYLEVRVFDLTHPVITLMETLEIPLASKWTMAQIMSKISVSDNVDDLTTDDLVLIEDTYSGADTVGSYHIKVQATDSSGNQSSLFIPISLIDRTKPLIIGPQAIYLYTSDLALSNQDILSKYRAQDDVDGDVSVYMITNHYHQNTQAGTYEILLGAHDMQGNVANCQIFIHVIENRGPIFEMDESILEISVKENMSEEDIIDWFKSRLSALGYSASHVRVVFNEYKGHTTLSGSYYVYLTYDIEGEELTSRIRIDVEDEEKSGWIQPILIGIGTLSIGFAAFYLTKRKKI